MKMNIARKVLENVLQNEVDHFQDMADEFKAVIGTDLNRRLLQFEPFPKVLKFESHSFKEALPYHDFDIYEVATALGFKPKFVSDLYCFEISSQNSESSWAAETAMNYQCELSKKLQAARNFAIDAWKKVNKVIEEDEYSLVVGSKESDDYIISVESPEPGFLRSYPYKKDFASMAKMAGFKKVEFEGQNIWLYIAKGNGEEETSEEEPEAFKVEPGSNEPEDLEAKVQIQENPEATDKAEDVFTTVRNVIRVKGSGK